MKTLFTLLLAVLAISANAANVTLSWDPADSDEEVTKYTVYEETSPTVWVKLMDTTDAQLVLSGVEPGKHTYAVTASNIWSESLMSDPVSTPKAVSAPKGVRVIAITVNVTVQG